MNIRHFFSMSPWLNHRNKNLILIILALSFSLVTLLVRPLDYIRNDSLVKRGAIYNPSPSGNVTLVLWNRSPKTPYAKILVELRDQLSLRRLYYGSMPYPDQFPHETGGNFHGHYRESHSFDLRPGIYNMIVHELKTGTACVQQVTVPPTGRWFVEITFDNEWVYDADSPYPHFVFEQGREPKAIL